VGIDLHDDLPDPVEFAKRKELRKELRKVMRKRRRALSYKEQTDAARRLFKRVAPSKLFRFSRRIAFSVARGGEIDPALLLLEAQRRRKKCYLPVMSKVGEPRLGFRLYKKGQKLVRNSLGIPEPARKYRCKPFALSLVLLPLVAFDAACNRMGMGKGFYDRTFAFIRRSVRQRPILLGLAHECQRVDNLEVAPWDVPLDGVVTDRTSYNGKSAKSRSD
jgi:5-formyltetrahydrofolate cyclo-ligase